MRSELRDQVVELLKGYGLKVKTDKNYHGVKVDVLAEGKDKKIFMYIIDSDDLPTLGPTINLSNLKDGNEKTLKIQDRCEYIALSSHDFGDVAIDLAEKSGIKLYTDIGSLKNILAYL